MAQELKTYSFPVDHGDFTATVELFFLKSEADKVISHHKYKRCFKMAKWCYAKWDDTATKYYKSVWYRKWEVKWIALAEKFKEA